VRSPHRRSRGLLETQRQAAANLQFLLGWKKIFTEPS
jgi:hypothetical protein